MAVPESWFYTNSRGVFFPLSFSLFFFGEVANLSLEHIHVCIHPERAAYNQYQTSEWARFCLLGVQRAQRTRTPFAPPEGETCLLSISIIPRDFGSSGGNDVGRFQVGWLVRHERGRLSGWRLGGKIAVVCVVDFPSGSRWRGLLEWEWAGYVMVVAA